MAEASLHERTEPATPRRRREAREQGRVARSQELNSAFVLLAGLVLLAAAGPFMLGRLMTVMRGLLGASGQLDMNPELISGYMRAGVPFVLMTLAPLCAAVVVVGLAVNFAQVGFVLSWKPLAPRFDALDPSRGFARIFSRQGGFELAKSLLKVAVVGWIAYLTVRSEIPRFSRMVGSDPLPIFVYAGHVALKLGLRTALAILGLAVGDYLFQRWEYERAIMMSHRELEEELRQTEGDPRVRARIRSLQREVAHRRMMEAVKTADVVVTNPTALAVALRYDREQMKAPQVVAKGARLIAERIRVLAAEHSVPVVEERPLARLLFKVEVGREIPVALYRAVAELLAYVYRLRNARAHRWTPGR